MTSSMTVAATSPRALPSSPSSSSSINKPGPGGLIAVPATTSSIVSAGEGTSYASTHTHPSAAGRSVVTSVSSLSDFSCGQLRHTLRCEMLPAEATDERFLLYKKYQVSVHGDNPETLTIRGFHRFLVESPIAGDYPLPLTSTPPPIPSPPFRSFSPPSFLFSPPPSPSS